MDDVQGGGPGVALSPQLRQGGRESLQLIGTSFLPEEHPDQRSSQRLWLEQVSQSFQYRFDTL